MSHIEALLVWQLFDANATCARRILKTAETMEDLPWPRHLRVTAIATDSAPHDWVPPGME